MLDPYNLPAGYNPGALSGDAIVDLILNRSGVAVITPRIQLLDRDLSAIPVGTAQGIAGKWLGDPADITSVLFDCAVNIDTTQAVHRQATTTILQPSTFEYDTLRHRLAIYVDFWDPVTKDLLLDIPIGVYRSVLPSRKPTQAGVTWTVSLLGQTMGLGRQFFVNPYVVPAGITYTQAIVDLLTMDYLPHSLGGSGQTPAGCDDAGPGFDLSQLVVPPCDQLVPAPISFDRSTSKQAALQQLTDAINYWPLWDDEVGNICTGPMPYYTDSVPRVGWRYATDRDSIIHPGSIDHSFDNQSELGNVVVVLAQNPANDAICSVAYNLSPASRISIPNMQEAIFLQPIQDSNIPDQATADLRALLALQEAAAAAETVSWTTGINPLHQIHDCLALNITLADGTVVIATSASVPWQETKYGFDFTQGGGLMTHSAGKIIAV